MATPPLNRVIAHRPVKALLTAITNFLGTELEFPVWGDSTNHSIYVQNPPAVPIDVNLLSGTLALAPAVVGSVSSSATLNPGDLTKTVVAVLDSAALRHFDLTLLLNFDANGTTAILQNVGLIPFKNTTAPTGTLDYITALVNLSDGENTALFGPTLSQNFNTPGAHCKAVGLFFQISAMVANPVTVSYDILFTKRA